MIGVRGRGGREVQRRGSGAGTCVCLGGVPVRGRGRGVPVRYGRDVFGKAMQRSNHEFETETYCSRSSWLFVVRKRIRMETGE